MGSSSLVPILVSFPALVWAMPRHSLGEKGAHVFPPGNDGQLSKDAD